MANDTALVQQMILNNQGGTVLLPARTYVVSGLHVPENTTVTSISRLGTTLQLARNSSAPIMFIDGSGVTIQHLAFDGDDANQTPNNHVSWQGRSHAAGIRIDPGPANTVLSSIRVNNCTFRRTAGSAIAMKRNINGLIIDNNAFSFLNGEAVFLDVQDPRIGSSKVSITNNDVQTVDNVNGANGFLVNQVNGLTFRYNSARDVDKNLVKATNVCNGLISNNSLDGNGFAPGAFAGIQLDTLCTNVEVSSNLLRNVYAGVAVNGAIGTSAITISNNTVEDLVAHDDAMGVKIGDATDGSIAIINNTLTGLKSDGIRIASGANGVTVTGNRLYRSASTQPGVGIKFDISKTVILNSLRITNNCIQGYGGTPPNRGIIFVNNELCGGSGVVIDNNIVRSAVAANRRTIHVGPSTTNAVSGVITNNHYWYEVPDSTTPATIQPDASNVRVDISTCP